MTHIIHRNLHHLPKLADRAAGIYIYDQKGKAYLDGSGGAAVSCLGHAHPKVLAAMHAQIDQLAYAHTSFFTSEVSEKLAAHLVSHAPRGLEYVYFVSGGSESIEAALKLARQYFVEIGQPQRTQFIARRQSYHGNTLGALSLGGNEWRRQQFEPLLIDVGRVAPCYEYRDRLPTETPEQYTQRLLNELEAKILAMGPETIIAFCAETIVGATAGVLPPTAGYFKGVRALCDRYGILFIADEVMCGMGRSGSLYAIEQEECVPDLLTIAKGLGGGYQPIGAVLVSQFIVEALRGGSGLFQHGHTYIGHSTACAAALAVQKVLIEDNLLANVNPLGSYLQQQLKQILHQNPYIGDIRGRGLFWGIELVFDKVSKVPFSPKIKLHQIIKAQAMKHGLLIYPMGGTIDGQYGDHILLAPPFICTRQQLDELVDKLSHALNDAIDLIHKETSK